MCHHSHRDFLGGLGPYVEANGANDLVEQLLRQALLKAGFLERLPFGAATDDTEPWSVHAVQHRIGGVKEMKETEQAFLVL